MDGLSGKASGLGASGVGPSELPLALGGVYKGARGAGEGAAGVGMGVAGEVMVPVEGLLGLRALPLGRDGVWVNEGGGASRVGGAGLGPNVLLLGLD